MRLLGGQLGSAPLQLWLFAHRLFLRREKNFEKTLAVLFFVAIIRPTSIMEATRDGEFEMTEQKMRSALLFLAGSLLSAGAWGQTVMFEQNNPVSIMVASEFFGSADGREVRMIPSGANSSQPLITLQMLDNNADGDDDPTTAPGQLGQGNEATITFTLNGATFASSVTGTHLSFYENALAANTMSDATADDESTKVSKEVTEGGSRGDASVTFKVTVATGTTNNILLPTSSQGPRFFAFRPPHLQVVPAVFDPTNPRTSARGVTVVANMVTGRTTSNAFPTGVVGESGATAPGTTNRVVAPVADGEILRISPAINARLTDGDFVEGAVVSLTDRKVIAPLSGEEVTLTTTGAKVRGLLVGRLVVDLNPPGPALARFGF